MVNGQEAIYFKTPFFLGRVAQRNPSDFTDAYPNFTSILFNLLGGEGDEDLRTLALETVGFVATTPEGKIKLNSFGPENVVDILTRYVNYQTNIPPLHFL